MSMTELPEGTQAVILRTADAMTFTVMTPHDWLTHRVLLFEEGVWTCNCRDAVDGPGGCEHLHVVLQEPRNARIQAWVEQHVATAKTPVAELNDPPGPMLYKVTGAAYTLVALENGGYLLLCETIHDTPPTPYGMDTVGSPGMIGLKVRERWNRDVLPQFFSTSTAAGNQWNVGWPKIRNECMRIFESLSLEVVKLIRVPGHTRIVRYEGVVVTSVDSEWREFTVAYTGRTLEGRE